MYAIENSATTGYIRVSPLLTWLQLSTRLSFAINKQFLPLLSITYLIHNGTSDKGKEGKLRGSHR